MHRSLAFLLALPLLLAGCLGDEPQPEPPADGGDDGGDQPPAGPLPETIDVTQDVTAGTDPFNFVGFAPCSQQVSTCDKYSFTVEANVSMDAALTWTLDANDFDLYLYRGEEQIATAGDAPPETEERITLGNVAPGDYELWVVAWAVGQDTYHLLAEFGPPTVAGA